MASGCPSDGCAQVIRIDSATYDDGVDRWFFYTWFEDGNKITSFRFGSPQDVIFNAGPAVFDIASVEEAINEGPELFVRNGKHYLFFSGGRFDSQYAMYYIMSDAVSDLTRARAVRRHSLPLRRGDGTLLESHGHNVVVERHGEYWNVFHVGELDVNGNLAGRSTYKQRLAFADDGSILPLNYVDVRWSERAGAQYSLDVVRTDGTVVGRCIAVDRLGASTHTRYAGVCPDSGDLVVAKSDIAGFRLYYSTDGATWTSTTDVSYDGSSDRVFIPVPGGTTQHVHLRWNELATRSDYSLDVQREDGSWITPCVGDVSLGSAIEHDFTGACPQAAPVAIADVKAFRVCSAVGGNWQEATCGVTEYDGVAGFVDVAIP